MRGIQPEYEQKFIEQHGVLTPLATPDGAEGSLTIHQDASMYRVKLAANESLELDTTKRPGYLHIIEGDAVGNELELRTGDGLGAYEEAVKITAGEDGLTGLWFDLPTKLQ